MRKIYFITISVVITIVGCTNAIKNNISDSLKLQKQAVDILASGDFGKLDEAISLIDSAITISPQSEVLYITKAQIMMQKEEYGIATDYIDKAISLKPEVAEYWGAKGMILLMQMDSISAYNSLNRAIELYDEKINNNINKENNLINKYAIKYLVSNNRKQCIDSLKAELDKDSTLNKDLIESGIDIIENIDTQNLLEIIN